MRAAARSSTSPHSPGSRATSRTVRTAATKYGVRGLTQVAAVELGPTGIRVNSVHPGPIDTDMLPASSRARGPDAFRNVPLQRVGAPDEVAALVLFLASDESSYLSGAEITVDGGLGAGQVPPS